MYIYVYMCIYMYIYIAIKYGFLITSATEDAVFAAGAANDSQAEREIKQTYDKLVGYMA